MPLFFRKALVDFIETGLAALFALTLAIPGDLTDAKGQMLIVGAALAGALIAAARRAIPGFLAWLNAKLGTNA